MTIDPDTAQEFFDVNALAHETVFNTFLLNGVVLSHYPLWTGDATNDWLEIHYLEHQAWSVALNLPMPPDFGQLNIENPSARQAWLYNHLLHHQLVAGALNL